MNKEDLIEDTDTLTEINTTAKLHKLLIPFEIEENHQVALPLHCSTNDSNVNMQNTYLVAMLLNAL